jgi:exo-beta-1,3-glucanase (GH17 family)
MHPTDAYNAPQPDSYHNYPRSPPRKPVAPYARQPPAPYQGQSNAQTPAPYTAYRPQHSDRDDYPPAAIGGVGAANSAPPPPPQHHIPRVPIGEASYGQQHRYASPDPFSDPYSSERVPTLGHQSQTSLPPSGAASTSHSVGYGYGNDQSMPGGRQPYRGDGYDEYMNPHDIADDGDDFIEPPRRPRSRFGLGAASASGPAAAGSTVMNSLGGRDASGNYGPVGGNNGGAEKSEWLKQESNRRKKLKWIFGIIIVIVILGIVGGIVAGVLLNQSDSSDSSRGSSSDNGDLWDIDSSQVQAVLNNNDLHRVFPGMDYTPLNAQYPACLTNPPYQNDVTLDVAVLAQLTPAIRLYGTDCRQTEQVLKGIDLLGYNDTVKVWLGVWLGDNSTTNARQLNQMYDILDTYPLTHFAGIIIGNEVLFREDLTITQLASQLTKARQELASRNINLPVATSDLGDDWTAELAADSDIVMSNVHPFFAGVTPQEAPSWTREFWTTHDVILKSDSGGPWPANIISETGWPSEGGNSCGGPKCTSKTQGSVAGIDELNEFMDGWVCSSIAKKTTYFWYVP